MNIGWGKPSRCLCFVSVRQDRRQGTDEEKNRSSVFGPRSSFFKTRTWITDTTLGPQLQPHKELTCREGNVQDPVKYAVNEGPREHGQEETDGPLFP